MAVNAELNISSVDFLKLDRNPAAVRMRSDRHHLTQRRSHRSLATDQACNIAILRINAENDFITAFASRMANAVDCPVKREMPDNMKEKLDEYLTRKRPAANP